MTSDRRARMRPAWIPALLLAILLMAAALAACSGESSGSDAPRDEPRSQETESRNDYSVSAGDGDDTANGVRDDGQEDAAGLFVSVSAGYFQTCGVRSDGSVACWGDGYDGEATPPAGPFVSVSAGGIETCRVRSDGSVACFDSLAVVQATPPAGFLRLRQRREGPHLRGKERRLRRLLGQG